MISRESCSMCSDLHEHSNCVLGSCFLFEERMRRSVLRQFCAHDLTLNTKQGTVRESGPRFVGTTENFYASQDMSPMNCTSTKTPKSIWSLKTGNSTPNRKPYCIMLRTISCAGSRQRTHRSRWERAFREAMKYGSPTVCSCTR